MLSIRPASVEDVGLLRNLIRELADYEKELDSVEITEEQLREDGFGDDPKYRALIAEWDGRPVGYAFFFGFYSTWMGRHMILEDLYVKPEYRSKGLGRQLMAQVAQIARAEKCRAMRWEVLGWNQKAIDVYKGIGAEFLDDWRLMMLRGEPLKKLAEQGR
jgi:GNAT superfamily N-acetyltransferase